MFLGSDEMDIFHNVKLFNNIATTPLFYKEVKWLTMSPWAIALIYSKL